MRFITKVALAIKGDRVEKGTEVELTDEDLKQYDIKDFESPDGIVEEPAPVDLSAIAVEDLNYEQAKARAKELGLSASGSKADLQERIALHLSSPSDEETTEEDNADDPSSPSDEETTEEDISSDLT